MKILRFLFLFVKHVTFASLQELFFKNKAMPFVQWRGREIKEESYVWTATWKGKRYVHGYYTLIISDRLDLPSCPSLECTVDTSVQLT